MNPYLVGFLVGVFPGYALGAMFHPYLVKDQQENRRRKEDPPNWVVLAMGALVLILSIAYIQAALVNQRQTKINEDALYTSCMNANETRQAQWQIWNFILSAELADEDNNPAEKAVSQAILPWIKQVFAERDCEDLTKQYPLPPVPKIPGADRSDR